MYLDILLKWPCVPDIQERTKGQPLVMMLSYPISYHSVMCYVITGNIESNKLVFDKHFEGNILFDVSFMTLYISSPIQTWKKFIFVVVVIFIERNELNPCHVHILLFFFSIWSFSDIWICVTCVTVCYLPISSISSELKICIKMYLYTNVSWYRVKIV